MSHSSRANGKGVSLRDISLTTLPSPICGDVQPELCWKSEGGVCVLFNGVTLTEENNAVKVKREASPLTYVSRGRNQRMGKRRERPGKREPRLVVPDSMALVTKGAGAPESVWATTCTPPEQR